MGNDTKTEMERVPALRRGVKEYVISRWKASGEYHIYFFDGMQGAGYGRNTPSLEAAHQLIAHWLKEAQAWTKYDDERKRRQTGAA